MCLHLVNVAVPRYHVKKLLSGGAKVLKNLEEETGRVPSVLVCVGLTEKSKKEITSKSF